MSLFPDVHPPNIGERKVINPQDIYVVTHGNYRSDTGDYFETKGYVTIGTAMDAAKRCRNGLHCDDGWMRDPHAEAQGGPHVVMAWSWLSASPHNKSLTVWLERLEVVE